MPSLMKKLSCLPSFKIIFRSLFLVGFIQNLLFVSVAAEPQRVQRNLAGSTERHDLHVERQPKKVVDRDRRFDRLHQKLTQKVRNRKLKIALKFRLTLVSLQQRELDQP